MRKKLPKYFSIATSVIYTKLLQREGYRQSPTKRKDSFLLIAQIETKVIERAGTEYLIHSISTRLQVSNILVLKNDIKCKRNEGGNE